MAGLLLGTVILVSQASATPLGLHASLTQMLFGSPEVHHGPAHSFPSSLEHIAGANCGAHQAGLFAVPDHHHHLASAFFPEVQVAPHHGHDHHQGSHGEAGNGDAYQQPTAFKEKKAKKEEAEEEAEKEKEEK
mmetsp:Transcript_85731/g.227814  ORF Transcript_85731/g.227814 Transcript_85731/m.227814 type:complete len:133 (-) Transcript_85731:194-592(-)